MIETINGVVVWQLPAEGPPLGLGSSWNELIGESYGQGIDLFAIPSGRLDPEFFRLASGAAGEFIQKLQNYGFRIAVVGNIDAYVEKSRSLGDFVRETNRRGHHLFVRDAAELAARLQPA